MENIALGKTVSSADMHNEILMILVLLCNKSVIIKDRVLIWFMNVECVENFRDLPRYKPSLIYSLNNYIHCKNLPKLREKMKDLLIYTYMYFNSFNLYKNDQKWRSILEPIVINLSKRSPRILLIHMYICIA